MDQMLALGGLKGCLKVLRYCLVAWLLPVLCSCGGGGGGDGSDTAPTISDLSYSPTAMFQSTNGVGTITGTVTFSAPSGNLAMLRLTASSGADLSTQIPNAAGQTKGALTGQVTVSTATVGRYSFEIWVVDSAGNSSNHLRGTFDVLPNVGASWTQRASPATADLNRVAWSGSLFVAVGAAGMIVTSPDGVTWNRANSGTVNSLNGIAWVGTRFVAVGDQGSVLTSSDGITWTPSTMGRTDIALNAVAGSQSLLVVAGANVILTSADGVSWTERVNNPAGSVFHSVVSSGRTFVAVGENTLAGTGPILIWTSSDGLSWTSQTVGNSIVPALFDVTWSGTAFVAVGHGTGAVSSDGLSWKIFGQNVVGQANQPRFSLFASGVASDGQAFLAVGDAFGQIERSADGLHWAQLSTSLSAVNGIAGGNGRFVTVGRFGEIFSSP